MLGPSFNTLTADHMYFCHRREKFTQQVPRHSSSKPKTFSGVFIVLSKSTENVEHFDNKDHLIRLIFPELLNLENVAT